MAIPAARSAVCCCLLTERPPATTQLLRQVHDPHLFEIIAALDVGCVVEGKLNEFLDMTKLKRCP